ncbi:MAG: hypothetical protein ABW026_19350 [Microvirga sp.]
MSRQEEAALRDVLGPPITAPAGCDIIVEGERPGHSTLLIQGIAARCVTLNPNKAGWWTRTAVSASNALTN